MLSLSIEIILNAVETYQDEHINISLTDSSTIRAAVLENKSTAYDQSEFNVTVIYTVSYSLLCICMKVMLPRILNTKPSLT